jgi:GNAT superfamily N-acetyltransferase
MRLNLSSVASHRRSSSGCGLFGRWSASFGLQVESGRLAAQVGPEVRVGDRDQRLGALAQAQAEELRSNARAGRTPHRGRLDLTGRRSFREPVVMTQSSAAASFQVRPIAAGDRDALARFYGDLSEDSLEARFLGAAPGIGDGTARFFCGPDHEHREGIVAEAVGADGRRTIVGHLCLEPIGPGNAEMAIAVADAWQHRGLGRALLGRAVEWARTHGIAQLSASMRCSNVAVIGLIRSMGLPVAFGAGDGGVVEARLVLLEALPTAA